MPKILDACCGAKMFWFDRENPDVVYMDERRLETTLCDGRTLIIEPDVVGDFRQMPFPDGTFSLVVFDPPHLVKAGAKSWLALMARRFAQGLRGMFPGTPAGRRPRLQMERGAGPAERDFAACRA